MFFDKEPNEVDILEEEFVPTLRQLLEADTRQEHPEESVETAFPNHSLVGEVIDTHNPDLRAHVLVRWLSDEGQVGERWLKCVRGAMPRRGDRVLLEQPANWPEKLVTAIIEGPSSGGSIEENNNAGYQLELEQDQCLRINDVEGKPLVDIYSSSQGPVVRLLNENVDIEVAGKLRFKAATIELEAGRGGVDIRTEADTVVRSRFIRLN
jgi:hypothetical protein